MFQKKVSHGALVISAGYKTLEDTGGYVAPKEKYVCSKRLEGGPSTLSTHLHRIKVFSCLCG